jgi:type IV secretion system protein VirD4
VLASTLGEDISADWLLDPPDGRPRTVYVCAPEHEQRRLRPLFVALIKQIVTAVYDRAAHTGQPIDPPLLLCLDEAANIAPLTNLDVIASTGAGQGIQLLTVFQDLAQVRARWGERAPTILSSHRARLFGPGIADLDTLDLVSRLIGQRELPQYSQTTGHAGQSSTTQTPTQRPLAPIELLRQEQPGTAILLYGHLPPARLRLRPWYADRELRSLVSAPVSDGVG